MNILALFESSGLGIFTEISILAYENYDKVMHFTLYTGFGIVLYLTMHFSRNEYLRKYAILFALIIGVSYAITDEIHQSFVPGRSATIPDLIADTAGIVFSLIITPALIHIKSIVEERIHRTSAE